MWFYIEKVLKYDEEGNFAGIHWHKFKYNLNNLFYKSDNINVEDLQFKQLIEKDVKLYRYITRVLKYLYDEFNLFV